MPIDKFAADGTTFFVGGALNFSWVLVEGHRTTRHKWRSEEYVLKTVVIQEHLSPSKTVLFQTPVYFLDGFDMNDEAVMKAVWVAILRKLNICPLA